MTVVIIWEGASVGCTLLGCIIQKRKEISILWYRLLSFEKNFPWKILWVFQCNGQKITQNPTALSASYHRNDIKL